MKPKTALIILIVLFIFIVGGVFYLTKISKFSEDEKKPNELDSQTQTTIDKKTIKRKTENETEKERIERIDSIIEVMKETEAKSDSNPIPANETEEEKTERINDVIEVMKETEAKSDTDPIPANETEEEKTERINGIIETMKETEAKSN